MHTSKVAFYEASLARDRALEQRSLWWAAASIAAFLLPLAMLLLPGQLEQPHPYRGWFYIAYAFGILVVYMTWTARLRQGINRQHGMLCESCRNPHEGAALVHIAFTDHCPKCGTQPYEVA